MNDALEKQMKLIDLKPRWIHKNVFVFMCPHCVRNDILPVQWLSVKNAQMKIQDQADLFHKEFGDDWNISVVPMNESCAWRIAGDFSVMTVTPSLNAEASGHWHGHILDGQIIN